MKGGVKMVRYKLMFKKKNKKRWYNFQPTVSSSAKSRYSKIDSRAKAEDVKRELENIPAYKDRRWKIVKK